MYLCFCQKDKLVHPGVFFSLTVTPKIQIPNEIPQKTKAQKG